MRLIRQLLAESLLLAAMGGILGMAIAEIGVRAIVIPRLAPEFSAWGAVASDLHLAVKTVEARSDGGTNAWQPKETAAAVGDEIEWKIGSGTHVSMTQNHYLGRRIANPGAAAALDAWHDVEEFGE